MNDRLRLDSWKDIAAYLRRDVRTVIRWEQERGLPVHRVPGGKQARVFAYPDELDTWLEAGRDQPNHGSAAEPPAVRARLSGVAALAGMVAIAAIAILGAIVVMVSNAEGERTPAQVRISGRDLVALDATGEQLWTHRFTGDDLVLSMERWLHLPDVDGDGRNDVCIGAKGQPFEGGNWFAWWKRPEKATDAWSKRLIAEGQPGATNIQPGDLNGDGVVDFFATRGHGRGVVWFEGPDWKPHEVDPTLEGPHCLQVQDLDGDGDLDAATCAKIDKLAVWYENDGRGRFTPRVVGKDQSAYDIRILDMDGDRDLDLLIAGEFSANIVWYENPGRRAAR